MMQTTDNSAIAAFLALEPLGDAGHRGRTKPCFPFDGRIRLFFGQHFCGSEALCEFGNFGLGEQIAQKTTRFISIFERQESSK